MKRKNYSREEDHTIEHMWRSGRTDADIAKALDRSALGITTRRSDLRLVKHLDYSEHFKKRQLKQKDKTEDFLLGLEIFKLPELAHLHNHIALIEDRLAVDPALDPKLPIEITCMINGCTSRINPIKVDPNWGNLKHYLDLICDHCRSVGANIRTVKSKLEKLECPICKASTFGAIGDIRPWYRHRQAVHPETSMDSFKHALSEAKLITLESSYSGFIHTNRTKTLMRYDSLSELATLFFLFDHFPTGDVIEKLSKVPKNNRHSIKIGRWYFCPDFAIIRQGKDVGLAECKGRQQERSAKKNQALKQYCAKAKIKFVWLWAGEKPIQRTSKYYQCALKYHTETQTNLKIISHGHITAMHDLRVGKFIGLEDGNEYFERDCCVCGKKKFTKKPEAINAYCGEHGLNCGTSDELEKTSGQRICRGCEGRPALPIEQFPKNGGHYCSKCIRSKAGLEPKSCVDCGAVMDAVSRKRICASCSKDTSVCDYCNSMFPYGRHHRRAKKKGKNIFCSIKCRGLYKSERERYTTTCSICEKIFTARCARGLYCQSCKNKRCCLCSKNFKLAPQQIHKILNKKNSKGITFSLAKKTSNYKCPNCT